MNGNLSAILSASVLVAIIEGVREYLTWRRNRRDSKDENAEGRIKNVEERILALADGVKYILYDRIRYLGQAYIADREIDFDDRRILNNMHKAYHTGLGGNGDLDTLMSEVNRLPLKKKG